MGESIYRVTHLFSATFPDTIERIARKYMRSFCYISIGEPGGGKAEIDQRVEFIGVKNIKFFQLFSIFLIYFLLI